MWRIIIIGLILLFLFGGKRMGAIGRGLGDAVRQLRKALAGTSGAAEPVRPSTPLGATEPLQLRANLPRPNGGTVDGAVAPNADEEQAR